MCIGLLSAGLGFVFQSWLVLGIALALGVALDALVDSRFRRLELVVVRA